MLCLSTPIPGFPHFYYTLGANLGSLFHRDVSVMKVCSFAMQAFTKFRFCLGGRYYTFYKLILEIEPRQAYLCLRAFRHDKF